MESILDPYYHYIVTPVQSMVVYQLGRSVESLDSRITYTPTSLSHSQYGSRMETIVGLKEGASPKIPDSIFGPVNLGQLYIVINMFCEYPMTTILYFRYISIC